jgi:hypothetical protein
VNNYPEVFSDLYYSSSKLISERARWQQRYASYSNNQHFRPIVARCSPPAFQPPPHSSSSTIALNNEMVQDFVTLPSISQAVGYTFHLQIRGSEFYDHVAGFDV